MARDSPLPTPSQDGGEAFASAFGRRSLRRIAIAAALFFATVLAIYIVIAAAGVRASDNGVLPVDFILFWGAAKLALAGDALAVFDPAALSAVHGLGEDTWYPWAYPPGFMLLLTPLGAMSFGAAWVTFTLFSLTALGLSLRSFAPGPAWVLAISAPAFMPALILGQTTPLWAAGLLGALGCLRSRRFVMAGVLIGCLTLKPQLGLLIPVALIAARRWDVAASAALTTLGLLIAPTLVFGFAYWPGLMEVGGEHVSFLQSGDEKLGMMPSVFSALRSLGFRHGAGLAAQAVVTLGAGYAVWRAWADPRAPFDLRAAMLTAAIPLSTPYLWYYDSAFVMLTALFLVRAGALRGAGLWFALLFWVGPGLTVMAGLIKPEAYFMSREYILAELALAFALAVRAVTKKERPGSLSGPQVEGA